MDSLSSYRSYYIGFLAVNIQCPGSLHECLFPATLNMQLIPGGPIYFQVRFCPYLPCPDKTWIISLQLEHNDLLYVLPRHFSRALFPATLLRCVARHPEVQSHLCSSLMCRSSKVQHASTRPGSRFLQLFTLCAVAFKNVLGMKPKENLPGIFSQRDGANTARYVFQDHQGGGTDPM